MTTLRLLAYWLHRATARLRFWLDRELQATQVYR